MTRERAAAAAVALLLVAGLVVLPALAVCAVSWRDPDLKAMRACTLVEMANNVSLKDVFIQENRSAVLADMIGLMQGNLSTLINGTAKAEAILWASDSDTANRTAAENEAAQMVRANLTLGGNISVPDTSTVDAFVLFTDTLGHVFKDSLTTIAGLTNTIVNQGILAHVENDTVAKAAAIKWASDSDTANSSVAIKAEVILWASDSDTANRTGAENTASLMALANRTTTENTASLMALANRTGAANDATLMAAANRTLAANLSIMAQSLIVPSTGGATLYAPNESLGPVPVTYVGFPRGQWNASIAVGMPTAWTGGPLTAAFYWTADSSEGTVEWDFAGRCTGTDNQTISSYLGANTTILDTMGTKDNVYISDATAGTTMAGTPAGGAYCLLNFRRLSGAGTLISEAKLLGVRIYYPVV